MSIADYDKMISIIENNIKQSTADIIKSISSELGMAKQTISIFYKCMASNNDTLNKYIKKRKLNSILDEVKNNNMTFEKAALEYGFSEYSVFFKAFCKVYKKSPQKIMEGDKQFEQRPRYLNVLIEELYYTENSCFDSYDDLSCDNYDNDDNSACNFFIEADTGALTMEQYDKLAEIEKCRSIYGISKEKIIELYNDSIRNSIPLDTLCEIYADNLLIDEILYEYEPDEEVYDKDYMEEYYCNEMTLTESWEYFQGDDEAEFEYKDGKYVDESF